MPIKDIYVHQRMYNGKPVFEIRTNANPPYGTSNHIGYVQLQNKPQLYTVQIVDSSSYRGYYAKIVTGPPELIGLQILLDIDIFDHSVKTGNFVVPNMWPLTIERTMLFKEKGVLKLCAA